jgi:hypothetical protein
MPLYTVITEAGSVSDSARQRVFGREGGAHRRIELRFAKQPHHRRKNRLAEAIVGDVSELDRTPDRSSRDRREFLIQASSNQTLNGTRWSSK